MGKLMINLSHACKKHHKSLRSWWSVFCHVLDGGWAHDLVSWFMHITKLLSVDLMISVLLTSVCWVMGESVISFSHTYKTHRKSWNDCSQIYRGWWVSSQSTFHMHVTKTISVYMMINVSLTNIHWMMGEFMINFFTRMRNVIRVYIMISVLLTNIHWMMGEFTISLSHASL